MQWVAQNDHSGAVLLKCESDSGLVAEEWLHSNTVTPSIATYFPGPFYTVSLSLSACGYQTPPRKQLLAFSCLFLVCT